MVVIRLSPGGRKKAPVYKILVAEKGAKLTGRYIEKLGIYTPGRDANSIDQLTFDQDRWNHWVQKGAIPSESLSKLIRFHTLSADQQKTKISQDKAFRKKRVEKKKAASAKTEEAPAAQ
jgi:small subunit ribosomal protein S16